MLHNTCFSQLIARGFAEVTEVNSLYLVTLPS